jgi:hypothetical protein
MAKIIHPGCPGLTFGVYDAFAPPPQPNIPTPLEPVVVNAEIVVFTPLAP